MKLQLRNTQGSVVGSVEVRDDVFAKPMKASLVHQVVVGHLANARQGTASTKTRAQVSGGGRKPRAQKHTGGARAGSIRSPIWRGGGVTFGPVPRNYSHRTPRKMRRISLVATLSDKVRQDELIVLDSLVLDRPATRQMALVLKALGADSSVLLVADGADDSVLRAARNIPRLKMLPAPVINTLDLINHRKIIMTLPAVRKCEEIWGGGPSRKMRQAPPAVA